MSSEFRCSTDEGDDSAPAQVLRLETKVGKPGMSRITASSYSSEREYYSRRNLLPVGCGHEFIVAHGGVALDLENSAENMPQV